MRGQFGDLAGSAAEASYRAQRWEAAYEPAVGMTLGLATVIALGLGGYLVSRSELTIGQLTSLHHVPRPTDLADVRRRLGALAAGTRRAAWERLAPVLEAPLTLDDAGRAELPARAEIRFDRLGLSAIRTPADPRWRTSR